MQKIYRYRWDKNSLSKIVMEKLKHYESMRPKVEDNPKKKQPKSAHRIWDEANDLRLLNTLAKLYPDGPRHLTSSVWKQIAKNWESENITADQCKCRFAK
jgi:hypothetical protein